MSILSLNHIADDPNYITVGTEEILSTECTEKSISESNRIDTLLFPKCKPHPQFSSSIWMLTIQRIALTDEQPHGCRV